MLTRFRWMWMLLFAMSAVHANAAPSTTSVWTREGSGAFDFTATSVGTAGDVNCDGHADLIIGIPQDDEATCPTCGSSSSGTIEVFFGGPGKPAQPVDPFARPDWFTYTGNFDGNLGNAVAAGDVNGDGCDDVIATEHFPSFALSSPQRVHVFLGPLASISRPADSFMAPPDLPEWSATLIQRTTSGSPQSAPSVAAGDVNGDGIADVIVGQPEASNGQSEEGVVLVWLGNQNFASDPDGTPANVDWMAQSDQPNAHLGESVASAFDFNGDGRDDILAGAPDYNGHGWAFLWLGSPVLESAVDGTPVNKAWSLTLASIGSRLGQSVAAAGDFDGDGYGDILIGAPLHDAYGTNVDSGEALLVRGGSPLPASDTFSYFFGPSTSGGQLGTSVATAGDVNADGRADVLLGEPLLTLGANQAGRVHLILGRPFTAVSAFPADAATYTEAGTINNLGDRARYGSSAGTAGDWNADGYSDVIIGAPAFGTSLWGKAFVYLGSGETLATTSQGIIGIQANSGHGLGLGFAGDIDHDGFSDLVTGAPYYESEAAHDGEGRIFVTYGAECGQRTNCGPLELLLPGHREANQAGAGLGSSVAGAGDVNGDGYDDVIAGAPTYDGEVFCGPPTFICAVPDSGAAHLYMGSSSGLGVNPSLILQGGPGGLASSGPAGSQYGYAVAGAGDVNGDGYGDVLVGAPYTSSGAASDGRVFLYLGSTSGLSSTPAWSKSGGQANARFGIAVSTAGDVNRDGYSDVIIGADGYNGTGAAFVYLGQPGGLKASPVQTYTYFPNGGWSFGAAVGTAGDVNRDGFADIVIGGPTFIYVDDPLQVPTGIAMVFHGGVDGPSATPSQTLTPPLPQDAQRFGAGVAGAGDVNGDGYGDLIVGAHWYTGPAGFAQGRAYLYHGGPTGIASNIVRTFMDCPTSFCDLGHDVAGGHDMNGDGFSDVVLAAFKSDLGAADGGDAYLHMGNGGSGSGGQPLQASGFSPVPRALSGIVASVVEASMHLHSPAGRSRVQLEVEIEPLGQEFNGLNTIKGVFLDNGIFARDFVYEAGTPGTLYHWRARLRSRSPLFGRSRWVSLPGNGPREADYRVFADGDGDGINNAADVCRFWPQTSQADTDQDGRGNECECGDQNGDGQNTVSDIVAINTAIFNPALVTPLCDANGDGSCNVSDIVAVNIDIFSPASTTICARQPVPGP